MDRKQMFKPKSIGARTGRVRRRQELLEEQKKRRDAILKGKRMRRNTVNAEIDFTEEQVSDLTKKLLSDSEKRSENLKCIRRALSLGTALIDAFLNVEGSLQYLVDLITEGSDDQVEAAWCLNNISAGTNEQAAQVIEVAGKALIEGLKSGVVPLEDQCAWAVGNLAGGNIECRQSLKSIGAVEPLIELLKSPIPSVVHCAAFALSNLARDKETTAILIDAGIIPLLVSHLEYEKGKLDLLSEVCWVLTYLTACGSHEKEILKSGVLEKIENLVLDVVKKDIDNVLVLTPLLRCFGNIICSGPDDTIPDVCKNSSLFTELNKLLLSEHQNIRKECIWVLSNISAVDVACRHLVDAGLLGSISSLLSATFDLKKEAAYTLCNVASHGSEFCEKLLQEDLCVCGMVALLKSTDLDSVHYALSFIELIVQHTTEGVKRFEEAGVMSSMEVLEYNNDESLRSHADSILDTYFYKEDKLEEKSENDVNGVTAE